MTRTADYVELRGHSWYSLGAGASSVAQMAQRAAELEYPALGLTDASNLCGALEFSRQCRDAGVQPVLGVDLTVRDPEGDGIATFIAETEDGYANLCRLVSLAHVTASRTEPVLDARLLESHTGGLIVLLGAPDGVLARMVQGGEWAKTQALVERYRGWFGPGSVFLELQQHLAYVDTVRNKRHSELAERCGVATVATKEVWYHLQERARLHDALTAVRLNRSLSEVSASLKVNSRYCLKSAEEMEALFRRYPEAIANTRAVAERCSGFGLLEYLVGRYAYPECPVPPGYDALSWLRWLCEEAARRYGSVDRKVRNRIDEEFDLIERHGLAGFFLVYHRIVALARECMLELGYGHRETPLEWLPPGRGRGSSVSILVGYLIGLSHVDPLEDGLSLDRFLSMDTAALPDIDLDFPRDIRERLILRVIEE